MSYIIEACESNNVEDFVQFSRLFKQFNRTVSSHDINNFFIMALYGGIHHPEILIRISQLYTEINMGATPSFFLYTLTLPYQLVLEEAQIPQFIVVIYNTLTANTDVDISLDDLLNEIIVMDNPNSALFLERLFAIFPLSNNNSVGREILRPYLEKAYENTDNVFAPLFDKMVSISEYAPIPPWVKNFVYDPFSNPIPTDKVSEETVEKSKYDTNIKKALESGVPLWVVESGFTFENTPQMVYAMIENQDITQGIKIQADQEENEYAEFDMRENQLPFESDLQLPPYPDVFPVGDLLDLYDEYWDLLWDKLNEYTKSQKKEGKDVKYDVNTEEERVFLKHRLLSMPLYLLNILFGGMKLLKPATREQVMEDAGTFRVLGPKNALPDEEEQEYGGERMFISNVYDFNEDNDEAYYWFAGHCLNCGLRIRRFSHALRIPEKCGGWKGCYCSSDCALKQIDDDDIITQRLLEEVVNDLNTIGIQDRIIEDTDADTSDDNA